MKILLAILLLSPPLSLDWSGEHKEMPRIDGYVHYSGNERISPIVYTGRVDVLDLETEIHVYVENLKIYKALLILGPEGIDSKNCLEKFNKHVGFMTKKYGQPIKKIINVSSMSAELVYTSKCKLYKNGMKRQTVFWSTKEFKIKTMLIGDSEGYYIETLYVSKQHEPVRNNKR